MTVSAAVLVALIFGLLGQFNWVLLILFVGIFGLGVSAGRGLAQDTAGAAEGIQSEAPAPWQVFVQELSGNDPGLAAAREAARPRVGDDHPAALEILALDEMGYAGLLDWKSPGEDAAFFLKRMLAKAGGTEIDEALLTRWADEADAGWERQGEPGYVFESSVDYVARHFSVEAAKQGLWLAYLNDGSDSYTLALLRPDLMARWGKVTLAETGAGTLIRVEPGHLAAPAFAGEEFRKSPRDTAAAEPVAARLAALPIALPEPD